MKERSSSSVIHPKNRRMTAFSSRPKKELIFIKLIIFIVPLPCNVMSGVPPVGTWMVLESITGTHTPVTMYNFYWWGNNTALGVDMWFRWSVGSQTTGASDSE